MIGASMADLMRVLESLPADTIKSGRE